MEGLHSSHGTAGDAQESLDAEVVDEMALGVHHVGDGQEGKIQGIGPARFRVQRCGTRRALATADDIGTDNEIFIGVKAISRADHLVPPARIVLSRVNPGGMGIPGEGVEDKDGIGPLCIEATVGLMSQGDGPQLFTALEEELVRGRGEGEILGLHYLPPRGPLFSFYYF